MPDYQRLRSIPIFHIEDELVKLRRRVLDPGKGSDALGQGWRNRKVFRWAETLAGGKFDISHAEGVGEARERIIFVFHIYKLTYRSE